MMQPSSSLSAQQRLADLEKTNAPFQEQLLLAAEYNGIDIASFEDDREPAPKPFYGKEERLVRWLLNKMQVAGGKR